MVKTVAKCAYCKDPIYDSDGMVVVNGKKYHANKEKLLLGQLFSCLNLELAGMISSAPAT